MSMKRVFTGFRGVVLIAIFLAVRGESEEILLLTNLFNGKDLSGWSVPQPNPFWKVQDEVLIGENDGERKGSVLYTADTFADFLLELEVRWSGDIDSGVMLRKPELQLQFGVSRSLKKDMTCSFYTGGKEKYPEAGQAKLKEGLFRPGDWNKVRLKAKGNTFTVWLNNQRVTEYKNATYSGAAPVGLQIHPGVAMKVEFRNIRITRLH